MPQLCEMNPHREYCGLCQACMITPTYNKKIFNEKKNIYIYMARMTCLRSQGSY